MGMLTKETMAAIRRGAWEKTVNDPIPEHVKEFAARKNPLYGAHVISTMTADEYRKSYAGGTNVTA